MFHTSGVGKSDEPAGVIDIFTIDNISITVVAMAGKDMRELIRRSAGFIRDSRTTAALTGAGISVESEIPAFRGKNGLWERYDPEEYAHIDSFIKDPKKVWKMLKEFVGVCREAEPNTAHTSLASLEEMGLLAGIITQNVDGLHQRAGSSEVIEFHGGNSTHSCLHCKKVFPTEEISLVILPPLCSCGGPLRPDFVFFGEAIPQTALLRSIELSHSCELMLIIGTTGLVMPAAQMPYIAKSAGARLIEINPEQSAYSGIVDIFLEGKASEIMDLVMKNIPAK